MNSSTAVDTPNGMTTLKVGNAAQNTNHNHQLRTLLSIRRFSAGLQEHSDQLKQIENDLNALSKNAAALLVAKSEGEGHRKWEVVLDKVNSCVYAINQLLNTANTKVEQKDRSDSSDLWRQIEAQIAALEVSCKEMEDLGFELLEEREQKNWKTNVFKLSAINTSAIRLACNGIQSRVAADRKIHTRRIEQGYTNHLK